MHLGKSLQSLLMAYVKGNFIMKSSLAVLRRTPPIINNDNSFYLVVNHAILKSIASHLITLFGESWEMGLYIDFKTICNKENP